MLARGPSATAGSKGPSRLPSGTHARVSPDQKSRVIRIARRSGADVGFLGDGVNDAVALHAADVGISVDSATEVARDAADIVLLDKDLGVVADGVTEGRRIFANTLKYVLMATSSNFGNMFSAAGASLFLTFLPMLPSQILLNNLLYDVGQLAIPTDNVDPETLARPAAWDITFVRRFMSTYDRSAPCSTSPPSSSCCASSMPATQSSAPAGSSSRSPPRPSSST
jgi:P-type Mg2+ transporter